MIMRLRNLSYVRKSYVNVSQQRYSIVEMVITTYYISLDIGQWTNHIRLKWKYRRAALKVDHESIYERNKQVLQYELLLFHSILLSMYVADSLEYSL